MLSTLITIAGCIGLALVLRKLFCSFFNIFYPYLVAKPRDLHELAGASWAVVTGATDGIGKAYATELARLGFDLVLISRSADKLEAVAEEIKQHTDRKIQVRTVQFDFTDAKIADYEQKIFAKLEDIQVGILVNNVGMVQDYPAKLDQCPGGLQQIVDLTIINTLPVTLLSAFVLKQMAQRRKGIIVNIASSAAYCKWYYYAVYSATKKCTVHLSSVLRKEFAADMPDLVIQTVCPMLVATKMAKRTKGKPSWIAPSPATFVRQAMRTIGIVEETTGCLSHQIQAELIFNYVPSPVFDFMMRQESHRTRAKALEETKDAKTD